ncbi:Uncharacterised protein [Vibrio cholerae]|nr:Uncharacterised protein [Vibrio cholerae]
MDCRISPSNGGMGSRDDVYRKHFTPGASGTR